MTRLASSITGILIVSAMAFVFNTEAIAGYRWPGGGPGKVPPLWSPGRYPNAGQPSIGHAVGRNIHVIGSRRLATKHNIVRSGIGSHIPANNLKNVQHGNHLGIRGLGPGGRPDVIRPGSNRWIEGPSLERQRYLWRLIIDHEK